MGFIAIDEEIDAVRAVEVAAFEEDGGAVELAEFFRGVGEIGRAGNFSPQEDFGFRKIGSDQLRERQKDFAVGGDGVVLQE